MHVDYRQIEVGGDDSWCDWPHEQYLIRPNTQGYKHGFTMILFNSSKVVNEMSKYKY